MSPEGLELLLDKHFPKAHLQRSASLTGVDFRFRIWEFTLVASLNEKPFLPGSDAGEVHFTLYQSKEGEQTPPFKALSTDSLTKADAFLGEVRAWLLGVAFAIEMALGE